MKEILLRLKQLVVKVLSVKGVVFIISTILMFNKILTVEIWSFFAAGFCGLRTLDKLVLNQKDQKDEK
jgi:hypothetical protein